MKNTSTLNINIVTQALANRHVVADGQRLPDELLKQSIMGKHKLTKQEQATLLGSPATLKRFKALSRQAKTYPISYVDNFIYRAADSNNSERVIDSAQGKATLHITEGRKGSVLVLKLAADLARKLAASAQQIQLTIGNINLPYKAPNAQGEVSWLWQHEQPLNTVLQRHGNIALTLSE